MKAKSLVGWFPARSDIFLDSREGGFCQHPAGWQPKNLLGFRNVFYGNYTSATVLVLAGETEQA